MSPSISIINTSELFGASRLDAECYKQELLTAYSILEKKNTLQLSKYATIADGDHAKFPENQSEDKRYLRAQDIKNNTIIDNDPIYVSNEYFEKQKRSHISGENILVSIMGSVGDIVITPEGFGACIANRAICIVKNIKVNPYFVYAYLLTDTSAKIMERLKTGGVQERLNLEVLRNVMVPVASDEFSQTIEKVIKSSQGMQYATKHTLEEISENLSKHLGFADFTPSTVNFSSRSSKEPTETSRFDGEYWLPMYDEIEKKIAEYPHGYDSFDKLIEVSSETISPDADETYKYAELSNVIASIGLIEDASELYGNELPSRARMKLRKDDVVLSSVEGSADKVAIVKVENNNLVGSTGFFVLRKKHLLPEVILALLRIPHINAIYKRQAQGTILTAVPRGSLSRVMMPKIPETFQQEIASQVQEAHKLHNESKRLLEVAKRAVEVFIEQDESAALEYIGQSNEQS